MVCLRSSAILNLLWGNGAPINRSGDIAMYGKDFAIWPETACSRPFWGIFPPYDVSHSCDPGKDRLWAGDIVVFNVPLDTL